MRKLVVLLLALMLVGTVGCGTNKMTKDKEPTKKEVVQIEETVEQEDSTSTNDTIEETTVNSEDSNENQDLDNKNETTTKPNTGNTDSNKKPSTGSTTKPSTGSTNNSGNTGNTQNNSTSTTTQPSTPVHEHNWVEVTEEVKHYYDWRSICGKCGTDLTDMTSDDRILHVGMVCGGRYSVKFVEVDYVTENIKKETIVTGYKCECGAEKK